jgi:hypothetical protein
MVAFVGSGDQPAAAAVPEGPIKGEHAGGGGAAGQLDRAVEVVPVVEGDSTVRHGQDSSAWSGGRGRTRRGPGRACPGRGGVDAESLLLQERTGGQEPRMPEARNGGRSDPVTVTEDPAANHAARK